MSDLKKEIERIIAENDIDAYDLKPLRDLADALEAKDKRIEQLESALRNIEGLAESKYIASVAKQALKGEGDE